MTSEPIEISVDANDLPRRLLRGTALLCIGFGVFRIVMMIGYTAANGIGQWRFMYSPMSGQSLGIVMALSYLFLSILLLIGGVGLLRARRFATTALITWALLDAMN